MHASLRRKAKKDALIFFLKEYEDGDTVYFDPVAVKVRVFFHESRKVTVKGMERDYSTSIHIEATDLGEFIDKIPMRILIDGIEYQVQATSYVESPFTQKLTTVVLKV